MNVDEMERVATYLADHPNRHQQGRWTCASGACYAGHAAILNGWQPMTDMGRARAAGLEVCLMDEYFGSFVEKDGVIKRVSTVAKKIFGIETAGDNLDTSLDDEGDEIETTSDVLFHSGNTAEKIKLMVKDLANGEDITKIWREEWVHQPNGDVDLVMARVVDEEEE